MNLKNAAKTIAGTPRALVRSPTRDTLSKRWVWLKAYLGSVKVVQRKGLDWYLTDHSLLELGYFSSRGEAGAEAWLDEELTVQPGKVFIDVGAHIGFYSIIAAKQGVEVHAFEPNPKNLYWVKRNAELNKTGDNLHIHGEALGSTVGSAAMSDSSARSSLVGQPGGMTVTVSTLDSLGLKKVDLVKVDTEGYELPVLMGGRETLKASHPKLVVEVHSVPFGLEEDIAMVSAYLEGVGYADIKVVHKEAIRAHLIAN